MILLRSTNILFAEDDKEIRELVKKFLQKEGYNIDTASDGKVVLELFDQNDYQILLLDIMLPGVDGIELCKKVRNNSNIPIIMITAKDGEVDKVLGLRIGADDYITKPFLMRELLARIKAQLRRYRELGGETTISKDSKLKFGSLYIDLEGYLVKKDKKEISLTSTEFKILQLLVTNPGKVFTKKQIFNSIWGEDYLEADNNIMVHIRRLRTKIEDNSKEPKFIKTVWGIGYKFESDFNE